MTDTATPAVLSPAEMRATQAAIEFQSALAAIDLGRVPVISRDRFIPRKEQARLARGLLKQLALVGVSVKTPSYSGAQGVEVSVPSRRDYLLNQHGTIATGCPVARANQESTKQMERLLITAFPNSGDRSDGQSDYFDYRWSVNYS